MNRPKPSDASFKQLASQYLTPSQVVDLYPFLSQSQLERLRATGTGPRFTKLGDSRNSRVVYRRLAIDLWLESKETQ